MRVLITGCSTYLGYLLTKYFILNGDTVYGVDLTSPKIVHPNFQYTKLSKIEDVQYLKIGQEEFDICYHLLEERGTLKSDLQRLMHINFEGTRYLLEGIKDKIKKVIFVSDCDVYGDQKIACTEKQRVDPTSKYGLSKMCAEKLFNLYNIQHVILRPFNVYGEGVPEHKLIPNFIKNIKMGNPLIFFRKNFIRDYIHVDEVITCLINAAELKNSEIINVGSGKMYPSSYLISTFREVAKFEMIHLEKEVPSSLFSDNTKMKSLLRVIPSKNFKETTHEMIVY